MLAVGSPSGGGNHTGHELIEKRHVLVVCLVRVDAHGCDGRIAIVGELNRAGLTLVVEVRAGIEERLEEASELVTPEKVRNENEGGQDQPDDVPNCSL